MSTQQKPRAEPAEVETTGHSWDGIEELDHPMPRWWLWVFYLCIFWSLAYSILYPAWPLIKGATPGLLGWSTRGAAKAEMAAWHAQNAPMQAKLVATPLDQVSKDGALQRYAVSAGGAVFRTNCVQCHGAGAAGNVGYPNLLDDDWLSGGSIDDIYFTIKHGIRSEADENTRMNPAMPAWKDVLSDTEIADVVQYVLKISGRSADPAAAAAGAAVFADNCAACHGDDGKGDRDMGAPNLTDAIWLYGGDQAAITRSIEGGLAGVMPNWSPRLSEADIRAVAIYVHGLGGGE